MTDTLLHIQNLTRSYCQGDRKLEVLRGVNLSVKAGEMVALVGESGSGKSTLLQIVGLLDKPDSGEILLDGKPAGGLTDAARTRLRSEKLGFIYQFHHLLPEFTAKENVMMPLLIAGESEPAAATRAEELLAAMGLSARAAHRPAELSGGEQQRVAIARAFANRPALVLADEPTGNLDPATAEQVFQWFVKLTREQGCALLMATHNQELSARADRVLRVVEGRLER
jgi:lipoprotein-releasing system ATP-binding protein